MELTTAIDEIEAGRKPRADQLPQGGLGLSDAFFLRVYSDFGANSERALRLSKKWKVVAGLCDDHAPVLRARALGEWIEGKWTDAARSFYEAGRSQADGSWVFAIPAIDAFARAGKLNEAENLARVLLQKQRHDPYQCARIRINLGNAYELLDHFKKGFQTYKRAVLDLDPDSHPLDYAKAMIGLSSCQLYLGDLAGAEAHAQQALDYFRDQGQTEIADMCAANLAQVWMQTGKPDEALEVLVAARDRASQGRRPWLMGLIGEAYLRLNLWTEALDSLEGSIALIKGNTPVKGNLLLLCGLTYAHLGKSQEAKKNFTASRNLHRRLEDLAMGTLAELCLFELDLESGEKPNPERAAHIAATFNKIGWSHAQMRAILAEQTARWQRGLRVESKVKSVVKNAIVRTDPALLWRAYLLLARTSQGTQQLRHYRMMVQAILEGRMLVRSTTSRASYFADKTEAITEFLGLLLRSGRTSLVQEAYEIVVQTRSTSLIDEILSATAQREGLAPISSDQAAQLEILRQALAEFTDPDNSSSHLRRTYTQGNSGRLPSPLTSLSRRWHEVTVAQHSFLAIPACSANRGAAEALVCLDSDILAVQQNGTQRKLLGTQQEIQTLVNSFQFELMEPLVQPDPPAGFCEDLLKQLGRSLSSEGRELPLALSPDSALWHVPWQALMEDTGKVNERILQLVPSETPPALYAPLPSQAKVLVLLGETEHLPNIAKEGVLIQGLFPEAQLCRSRAKALELLAHNSYDLIHVAAHASHVDENPMFSFIHFPDGNLYATEISRLPFSCRFAVLFACESGRLTIPFAREPDGLARAFLARGAQGVIGSAWYLDDEAALRFAHNFYQNLVHGKNFVQSLADARKELRAWRAHPFYWAAPVIFSGYASSRPNASLK